MSLNLCSNGHAEICYDGWDDCPACKIISDKDEEIAELKIEIAELTEGRELTEGKMSMGE